jgi:hypothetical protein
LSAAGRAEVWRKKAVVLRRRLRDKERELREVRRRVLEAVGLL